MMQGARGRPSLKARAGVIVTIGRGTHDGDSKAAPVRTSCMPPYSVSPLVLSALRILLLLLFLLLSRSFAELVPRVLFPHTPFIHKYGLPDKLDTTFRVIYRLSKSLRADGVIICGDFNMTPDSAFYHYMVKGELSVDGMNR